MRNIKIITALAIILMLSSCSISSFGKFQAGETSRTEVLETLGEHLVHRVVAGR